MKSILITGGTGSFGNAFVRHLLNQNIAERIVIYSRDEQKQEQMALNLSNDERLRFFIGDVRDEARLRMAMYGCDMVVHAAAMKIVPTAEYNPFECVLTNIHGAENVCRAAMATGVRRVVALSTDKAVNPINLYGATKLAAEKIFIAANNVSAGGCRYSIVRYGNVVGSRGSVVPLFLRQRASNSPITITDERMTRFWITMDEAITLVRYALWVMEGREIFIPKIPSVNIMDIAAAISPTGERKIIGVRPGEKIHETLMTAEESVFRSENDDFYCILPNRPEETKFKQEEFVYRSCDNTNWLSTKEVREQLIKGGFLEEEEKIRSS